VGKVQKLPESLIRLIAAGEVVERPASVIKELVENSLDAGARSIAIDVWGAGRTRIRVSDDGEGMSREDAENALDHHATSKLKHFDDLYQLATFGFRGEALPSIAAVSRLTLTTRTAADAQGWSLKLEAGKLLGVEGAGVPVGTTIDVQDLFFNTPARLKFLKRDATERTHILRTLEETAMAHPTVRFELVIDGKPALSLPSATTLGGRLADLWSISVAENMVPLEITAGPCTIRGLVNKVPAHHPTKAYQALFVNHRPVQQRMLNFAVYEAYREWLPVGRHPIFALFIEIDPKLVDVNVHPTKREVRFSDERALYDLLFRAIRSLFRESTGEVASRERSSSASGAFSNVFRSNAPTLQDAPAAVLLQSPFLNADLPMVSDGGARFAEAPSSAAEFSVEGIRYLGQFQRLYLLLERVHELIIVDQHAAAERVHYERLLKQVTHGRVARQPLLTPLLWEVSAAHAETVRSYAKDFETLGFGIEPFGPTTFALKEWPAVLPDSRKAKRFLEEVIDALNSERPTDKTRIHHEIAARAACRAAIMAGDSIAPQEVTQLLIDLAACERPMTCPHGRPTHIRLSREELDRRFKRI
jgi:DNA mismatch repair protein MutL